MMSKAMAKHIVECVNGGVDVSFKVGRLQITVRHIDDELHLYQGVGSSILVITDFDIIDDYIRIETDEGVLIGLPYGEDSA